MVASVSFQPNKQCAAVKTPRPEYHEPVLSNEVVRLLAPAPGRLIVDGTLGGAGHTSLLLAAGARVIGIDQDPAALAWAGRRLTEWGDHFRAVRGSFATAGSLLSAHGVGSIDG